MKRIADQVSERRGWDFSKLRVARDPVPWEYSDVVRSYLHPSSYVLDIGTGGGERFSELAPHFGKGVGIDNSSEMIREAQANLSTDLADRLSFQMMSADALHFSDSSFDLVLNRHSVVFPAEILRVLKSDGVFITQQVGHRNTQNICKVFGCNAGGEYKSNPNQHRNTLVQTFIHHGCRIALHEEYDVPYYFLDEESLIFWLKAIPIPEDFDIEIHYEKVSQIISRFSTEKGIRTNEHRRILIVQKP